MTAVQSPAIGSAAGLILSKLQPPDLPERTACRTRLLERLMTSDGPRLVSIVAPGGYGKTTLLAQWAGACTRAFAWLSTDDDDNDPALLVREIEVALRTSGALTGDEAAPRADASAGTAVNRLRAAVSSANVPFVLVLDDVHQLTATEVHDVLAALFRSLPRGSQLVLSGREELVDVVAGARATRDVIEIGTVDLALDDGEARALLTGVDASFTGTTADAYIRKAEGWAAGLFLLALTHDAADATDDVRLGSGRYVADYLWSQHLSMLPDEDVRFLVESSVLDRLSAPLCDAALERTGSAGMLRRIAAATPFLIPLDREEGWYRHHDLFREVLARRLASAEDPGRARATLERGADWCAAHDLPEAAMRLAASAKDEERMTRTFLASAFALFRTGRLTTLETWLDLLDDGALLARHPAVAAVGGLAQTMLERPFQAERWVDVALRNSAGAPPPPDGSATMGAWARAVSGMACRHGPEEMLSDAESALRDLSPFGPMYGPGMLVRAVALRLLGRPEAEVSMEETLEAATSTGATLAATYSRSDLVLSALARGDTARADGLHADLVPILGHGLFVDYKQIALPLAATARLQAAHGDAERARRTLAAFQRIRPRLSYALPWANVRALVEVARVYVEVGDIAAARAVLVDADEIVRHRPKLGTLLDDLAATHELARATRATVPGWEHSLTAAELRLLPLLTTHLSFREIGERLFVSRNTVKTQAISIYRKLGASSRGEAVERAAELGLIDPEVVV